MKKLLFMMMIASSLNAMQVQIMPTKSKVSREEERESHVRKFVIGVNNIHLKARCVKGICATSDSFLETRLYDPCREMYNTAKSLLAQVSEIIGTAVPLVSDTVRNREEYCRSLDFLVNSEYFLVALWKIMNTTSESQVRQQLHKIKEAICIVAGDYHIR